MIRSMTSFARENASAKEGGWVIEIRSVNHRFFDFSLRVPSAFNALEGRIRELVQGTITRGKISVAISQESDDRKSKTVSLHEPTVKFYLDTANKLKTQFKMEDKLTLGDLLKLPGIFTVDTPKEDPEKSWPQIKRILKRVLEQMLESKRVEGGKLATDMGNRLKKMTTVVGKVEKLSEGRSNAVYKRISEKVKNLIKDGQMDQDRLYREVALIAERSDITEETVRLRTHLELFDTRLKTNGPIGRELDFLCQEMNREVNTIGSKAQLFEISKEVVFLKGELEKVREQVQNVE